MKFKSLLLALAFVPAALVAAERNDVPSCYAQAKIEQFRAQGFKDGEKLVVSPRRARVFLQPQPA